MSSDEPGQSRVEDFDLWERFSTQEAMQNVRHPGILCGHCGMQLREYAGVTAPGLEPAEVLVCHPSIDAYPDCYRLVTVYGETLGARNPNREGASE